MRINMRSLWIVKQRLSAFSLLVPILLGDALFLNVIRAVCLLLQHRPHAVPVMHEGRFGLVVSCSTELTSMVDRMLAKDSGTFSLIWRMEARGRLKISMHVVRSSNVEVIAVRFGGDRNS
jgi:hypothetical protein